MKDLILLGGNELNRGVVKRSKLIGANRVIVFDWNEDPAIKADINVKVDVKDTKSILRRIDSLGIKDIIYAYTSIDLAVKTQIAIHKKFGLMYPNNDSVNNAMEKNKMIQKWQQKGLLNRFSYIVEDEQDVFEKCRNNICIIKPNMSSGSRGITILNKNITIEEARKAIGYAKEFSFDKNAIIEQFIQGTEYTVELLGDSFGNVSVWGISKKYHTPYNTHNKIAVKLHYNSLDVSDELVKRISDHAIKCYKALGLTNSFGHLELIVTDKGIISPLEIGARSSGFISSDLVDAINYESYLEEYSKVIRGKRIFNGYTLKKELSSMYYFYDIPPKKSIDECNLLDFVGEDIYSVDFNRSNLVKNKQFNVIKGDHERVGFEILIGQKNILTIEKIDIAEKRFMSKFMGE